MHPTVPLAAMDSLPGVLEYAAFRRLGLNLRACVARGGMLHGVHPVPDLFYVREAASIRAVRMNVMAPA
ncbi:hypothetical protein BX257_4003 [Streptomyces sp. 3212.3]|nr:hypothetical protein BX257_4003 [Streptomyces sp. 3212.3]